MRFDKGNHQNESIALMFLDEVAGVFVEKLWPRQLDREIADGYFRESSVRLVRCDAVRAEETGVVAAIICGNPLFESASSRPVLAEVPFADVSRPIILVLHQLRENAKPPIERHAVACAPIDVW